MECGGRVWNDDHFYFDHFFFSAGEMVHKSSFVSNFIISFTVLFIYPNQQCFTTNNHYSNHKSMKPRNSFCYKKKICLNQQIIWIKWFHQPFVQSGAKKCTKLHRLTEISILCTKWWNSLVLAAIFLFSSQGKIGK